MFLCRAVGVGCGGLANGGDVDVRACVVEAAFAADVDVDRAVFVVGVALTADDDDGGRPRDFAGTPRSVALGEGGVAALSSSSMSCSGSDDTSMYVRLFFGLGSVADC